MKRIQVAIFILLVSACFAFGAERMPVNPTPGAKCPVCGMFVAKYPDWMAEIIFKDGSVAFFDGAKDLFKYYYDLKEYDTRRTAEHIDAVYVSEYYDVKPINAYEAYFVIGSDVYGPMGRELIPFASEADAKEFMKDHKGKRILRFADITRRVIDGLD